jgi:hypothetical protein
VNSAGGLVTNAGPAVDCYGGVGTRGDDLRLGLPTMNYGDPTANAHALRQSAPGVGGDPRGTERQYADYGGRTGPVDRSGSYYAGSFAAGPGPGGADDVGGEVDLARRQGGYWSPPIFDRTPGIARQSADNWAKIGMDRPGTPPGQTDELSDDVLDVPKMEY